MTEIATLPSIDGTSPAGGEGFWEREATDVQGIEKALVALRKEYGSAAAAKEGHAGTRNSVANLVVYAASDEDAELVTATMAQLAGAHPGSVRSCGAQGNASDRQKQSLDDRFGPRRASRDEHVHR